MYFPFNELRPIQEQLISDVENSIKNSKCLIAHAPTGLGKTAATLSPALDAALKEGLTVFFLTPKHTQHAIAIETLQKIKKRHNLKFNVTDLIGKKWMCSHPSVDVLGSKEFHSFCRELVAEERCPFYNAVWGAGSDRLQGKAAFAMMEIQQGEILHAEDLTQRYKDEFCSYELASLLGKESTVVIADYYHIFHPSVRKAFLSRLNKQLKNSIIIVDEAHNLPGRIREILSEKLSQFTVSRAAKEAKALHFDDLATAMNNLNNCLDNLRKEFLESKNESLLKKDRFVEEVVMSTGFNYSNLIDDLENAAEEIRKREKKSSMGSVADFLKAWLGEDNGFARVLKKKYGRNKLSFVEISYNCLNPSVSSAEVFNECRSAVLMSGTLVPGELYRDLLGFKLEKTDIKTYPSPFEAKNRLVLIEPSVTTKFTKRDPEEFDKIAKICLNTISEVPHNVAVFFPSYLFMQSIMSYMEGKISKQIFVDKPDLTKAQRAAILYNFKLNSEKGAVLFGVQGGSMSEGVDLPGKNLECVIVVGVPLATPDLETQSLIDYYDFKFGKGWDYGYIYPAMTKSLQAAGRCVRSMEDRGCVIFVDERFTWKNYLKCIPPEWRPVVTRLTTEKVKKFFTTDAEGLSLQSEAAQGTAKPDVER
ncbi:MAG TPA: ATP-dependent DNA helicase [Candidatus Nanoarchaeia archaeon]|nr:ATP-dependent DNA helicase [Candidatus Nanoarchaeia archaeon]